ncbi:MAG: hypothetical protein HDQ88_05475, partial [Clostridia bacterium]|nr:hypothetical protein [Clostridia bacterium]
MKLMQKVPFHKKGQCPSCGNEVILDGTIDVNVPVKEVEVVVPQVVAPPIQAEWLKPSYEIKAFNVTTEDLLEYIRLQIQQIIPNANVAGVSLI